MVKCLNIGENIGKPIYRSISSLIKGISCQEKGDQNCSFEQDGQAQISGASCCTDEPDHYIVIAHLKG